MVPNHRFNFTPIEKRFQLYLIFRNYYKGLIWDVIDWDNVIYVIADYASDKINFHINKGLELLKNLDEQTISDALYDYNRLFVGPGRLLAPPFESVYRNPEKLVMQKETLEVRGFYQRAGLQVIQMGSQPDDHLAFELELVCYLLSRGQQEMYLDFFEQHLQQWVTNHCEDIIKQSSNDINRGMALILKGFIGVEMEELSSFKGGDFVEQGV